MIDKSRIAGFGVGTLADQCKKEGIEVRDLCSLAGFDPTELHVLVVDENSFNLNCRDEIEMLIERWREINPALEVVWANNLDDVLGSTRDVALKVVGSS